MFFQPSLWKQTHQTPVEKWPRLAERLHVCSGSFWRTWRERDGDKFVRLRKKMLKAARLPQACDAGTPCGRLSSWQTSTPASVFHVAAVKSEQNLMNLQVQITAEYQSLPHQCIYGTFIPSDAKNIVADIYCTSFHQVHLIQQHSRRMGTGCSTEFFQLLSCVLGMWEEPETSTQRESSTMNHAFPSRRTWHDSAWIKDKWEEGGAGRGGGVAAEMIVNKAAFLEHYSPSFLRLLLHVGNLSWTFPENSPTKIEETSIDEALCVIFDYAGQ